MLELIDIGLNLTHDSFDADREAVLQRALQAGVGRMIITGASVAGSVRALELADSRPELLYCTAGVHPHHAAEFDLHSPALAPLLRNEAVVAVGECGLDYFRNFSPPEAQERAFQVQLELAVDCGRPVFLHQREAHERFMQILRPYADRIVGGVAHCFTGGPRELDDYLSLGLHIGVTGWLCDERRSDSLRAALPRIPLDRMLLETDAPYLLPRDMRPKPVSRRNEPANLRHVLEHAAALLDLPPAELASATTNNAIRLFRLDQAARARAPALRTANEGHP